MSLASYRASTCDYDYLFKMLVVGDSGVGKSCLVQRFADDKFTGSFVPTIGVDFKVRQMRTRTAVPKTAKLQIWDTAGQDRFKAITASYYRGGNAIVLCYDTTDRESFDHLRKWLKEISSYARENVRMILVGTKTDVKERAAKARASAGAGSSKAHDDASSVGSAASVPCGATRAFPGAGHGVFGSDEVWETEEEDATALAEELGVPLVRCSAKTGDGVEEAFAQLVDDLVEQLQRNKMTGGRPENCMRGIRLTAGDTMATGGAGGAGAGSSVMNFFSRMCY